MKRKVLSTLLMGAFFLLSMSMFTSCKDYDDDINANKAAITELQEQLKTLQAAQDALKASVDAAAATYATKVELKAVDDAVKALSEQLAGYVTLQQLDEAKAAVQAAIEAAGKKSADDLAAVKDELSKQIAAIDPALDKINTALKEETSAREAADKNIQSQLDALDALVKSLTGGSSEVITNIKNDITNLTNTKADITKVNEVADEVAKKLDASKFTEFQNGDFAALRKAVEGKADTAAVNALNKKVAEILVAIADLQAMRDQIAANKADIATLKTDMQNANKRIDAVQAEVNILKVFVNKRLTGLVLKPAFYWEGLEAVEVPTLFSECNVLGTKIASQPSDKFKNTSGKPVIYYGVEQMVENGKVVITKGGVAQYHINPNTAKLDNMKYSFFDNFAPAYTRAGGSLASPFAKPVADKVSVENGILSVPFTVDEEKLEEIYANYVDTKNVVNYNPGHTPEGPTGYTKETGKWALAYGEKLPFIALQANDGDTVVTSDYAVVTPAKYTVRALADNDPDEKLSQNTFSGENTGVVASNFLYPTAFDAIDNYATHAVQYDSVIDLKPFIETQFDYEPFAQYGKSAYNQTMSEEMLELLGLHYEFTPVYYSRSLERTDESEHIEQVTVAEEDGTVSVAADKKSGVFAPRSVTPDGKKISGKVATREVIDREPLIRVDLVNEEGCIIEYGYIKLRIVEKKTFADDVVTEVDFSDFWMNCGDEGKITWAQVEHLMLSKLNGGKGLTKQEFEKKYYMEVVGAHKEVKPTLPIYAEGWQAVLYSKKNTKLAASDDFYGRVWYTPHDNTTGGFDPETNVLIWNLTDDATDGNMNAAKYAKLIEKSGATYASNGLSTKAIEVMVHFISKDENLGDLWVKLNIPVGKLHFQYGKVANRDLAHWFQFNKGYKVGSETAGTAFDVYVNTPTPAETGSVALKNNQFEKDLLEYWREEKVLLTLEGKKSEFSKFYTTAGDAKNELTFQFTTPKKDVNSTISATNGTWKVKGVSGTTWTLKLQDNALGKNRRIVASTDGLHWERVAEFITPTAVHYYGDNDVEFETKATGAYTDAMGVSHNGDHLKADGTATAHAAATDLLNLMGRYDAAGKPLFEGDQNHPSAASFLDANIDHTFTAYVEIVASEDPCYAPLIANNHMNLRFMRPINVWPEQKAWTDALNATETIQLTDLVSIRDWRSYKVSAPGNYSEGNVPYQFYNITDLAVVRDEIRTDHMEEPSVRLNTVLTDPEAIMKLPTVDKVASLTSSDYTQHFLKLFNGAGTEVDKNSTPIFTEGNGFGANSYGKIEYTNNGGGVQEFHLYIPIAVKYNWGNITDKHTSGQLDYTQVVWASITVKKTTGGGESTAKKN